MLSQGLVKEIRAFYNSYIETTQQRETKGEIDCTKGALQSIGLKEFIQYLEKYDEEEDKRLIEFLSSDKTAEQSPPESLILLKSCLEMLRIATKRYSRQQPKWITNRFLRSGNRQVPPMYTLSTSNPDNWVDDVYRKAENVIQCYIENRDADLKPCEQLENPRQNLDPNVNNVCESCNRLFIGEFQWRLHLRSNKHKKRVEKLKKQKYLDESTVNENVSDVK